MLQQSGHPIIHSHREKEGNRQANPAIPDAFGRLRLAGAGQPPACRASRLLLLLLLLQLDYKPKPANCLRLLAVSATAFNTQQTIFLWLLQILLRQLQHAVPLKFTHYSQTNTPPSLQPANNLLLPLLHDRQQISASAQWSTESSLSSFIC